MVAAVPATSLLRSICQDEAENGQAQSEVGLADKGTGEKQKNRKGVHNYVEAGCETHGAI
jgi:hypothetical protein